MNSLLQALHLELSDADQQKLESVLEEFELTWTLKSLGQWMKQWPTKLDHLRFPALVEMVKIDLERRWQSGEPRKLEFYLNHYPELGTPETVLGELVQSEIEVVCQHSEQGSLSDYQRRFPGRDADLSRWLSEESASHKAKNSALKDTPGPAAPNVTSLVAGAGVVAVSLPEHFGRYRILKPIGEGGMGSVFLAHDTELGRDVALKVPHLVPGADAEVLERFQREARAAAALQHPNVCPIHDVGIINETHYISMAYIRGRPLSDFVSNRKPPSPHAAALAVCKLAKTLQYAHKQGIIHRDLKPSNVMVDEHNQPIVMDFGLARKLDQSDDRRLTRSGVMLGSPAYLPPEQVNGEFDKVAAPTDIYSLGVIFYELLTGRVPFPGTTAIAVAMKILTEEPKRPSELRKGIDSELEHICLKMMSKKIEDRYATASEAADAISTYLKSQQRGSRKAATPSALIDQDEQRAIQELMFQIETNDVSISRLSYAHSAESQSGKRILIAAIAVAILVFGVIFLLKTPKGTIQVELKDPTLKVFIDEESLTVEELKSPLTIKTGRHTILVEADGKKLAPGDILSINSDENHQKLVIKLGEMELKGKNFEVHAGLNPLLTINWVDQVRTDEKLSSSASSLRMLEQSSAKKLLEKGWTLTIIEDGSTINQTVDDIKKLPQGRFHVYTAMANHSNAFQDEVNHVLNFSSLRELRIAESSINDEDLVYIRELDQLKLLELQDTSISDAQIPDKLPPNLEYLNITNSKVTLDGTISTIAALENLKKLRSSFANLSALHLIIQAGGKCKVMAGTTAIELASWKEMVTFIQRNKNNFHIVELDIPDVSALDSADREILSGAIPGRLVIKDE